MWGANVLASPWARGLPVLNQGARLSDATRATARRSSWLCGCLVLGRVLSVPSQHSAAGPGPPCAEGSVRGQLRFSRVRSLPALFLPVCEDQGGAARLPDRCPPPARCAAQAGARRPTPGFCDKAPAPLGGFRGPPLDGGNTHLLFGSSD